MNHVTYGVEKGSPNQDLPKMSTTYIQISCFGVEALIFVKT
jgi:hypothetical protein